MTSVYWIIFSILSYNLGTVLGIRLQALTILMHCKLPTCKMHPLEPKEETSPDASFVNYAVSVGIWLMLLKLSVRLGIHSVLALITSAPFSNWSKRSHRIPADDERPETGVRDCKTPPCPHSLLHSSVMVERSWLSKMETGALCTSKASIQCKVISNSDKESLLDNNNSYNDDNSWLF